MGKTLPFNGLALQMGRIGTTFPGYVAYAAKIVLAWAAGLLLVAGLAAADTRSVYTVTGIEVDETAPSVIQAQQAAIAAARLEGARRFIQKITLAEDRTAAGGVFIDQATADSLAAAVDVEEETRGGGRYIAVMSVVLNPRAVRAYLDRLDIPYLDRQAPLAVLVPMGSREIDFYTWQEAWPEQDAGALAQYIRAVGGPYVRSASWLDLSPEISATGASRAVLAELMGVEGAYRVRLRLVNRDGNQSLGTTNTVETMEDAVVAATAYLGEIWKREAIIRSDVKSLARASILYGSAAEWNLLRGALIRSPLVSDFQTIAIARDGAMVEFAFAGEDVERLGAELRQRGVVLDPAPTGWVLTSLGSGRFQDAR